MQFLKIESFRKGIAYSTALNFIVKLLQFSQIVLIAYFFGVQEETDVYFYCLSFAMIAALFIGNLESSIVLPESMRLLEQEGRDASVKFVNFFLVCYAGIGLLGVAILAVAPEQTFQLISKFDGDALERNRFILLTTGPLFALMIMTNLAVNVLSSYRYFTIPMLAGFVNHSSSVLFLLLFHNVFGVKSLLLGFLLTYSINLVVLVYLMRSRLNWNFKLIHFGFSHRVWKNIFFAQAGMLASSLAAYFPIFLLSGYAVGGVTALSYGQKTADIPTQLIIVQFSAVAGIKFNDLLSKKELSLFSQTFIRTNKFLVFVMTPISVLLYLNADQVISLLYQRGQFKGEAVQMSADFLRYLAFLLPLLAINTILARVFMAAQKLKEAFGYQIIFNVVLIVIMYQLVSRLGIIGYPVSLLVLYALNVFFMQPLVKAFFPFLESAYRDVIVFFGKTILLNGIVLAPFIFLIDFLPAAPVLRIGIVSAAYLTVIVAFNAVLRMEPSINDIIVTGFKKIARLR